jgi:hypothetical protein
VAGGGAKIFHSERVTFFTRHQTLNSAGTESGPRITLPTTTNIGQRVRDQASERLRRTRTGPSSDFVRDLSLHHHVATARVDAIDPGQVSAPFLGSICNDMRGTTDTTITAASVARNGMGHAEPSPEENLVRSFTLCPVLTMMASRVLPGHRSLALRAAIDSWQRGERTGARALDRTLNGKVALVTHFGPVSWLTWA